MGKQYFICWSRALTILIAIGMSPGPASGAQPPAIGNAKPAFRAVVVIGKIQYARQGAEIFDEMPAGSTNYPIYIGDRIRIGPDSSLALRDDDNSIFRYEEKSEFEVVPQRSAKATSPTVRLLSGVLYFFHRGTPGTLEVLTRLASAAVRGTEFEMRADENGSTVVTVIDGLVELSNEVDHLPVASGQAAVAEPGKAPVMRAAIDAINVIQWMLYYPGVLDVDEIPLSEQERGALRGSIEAYRAGDLLRALSGYPAGKPPGSDAEKIYRAALMVATGQINDVESLLTGISPGVGDVNARLAGALRQVIASVKLASDEAKFSPELASEWLSESYARQARADLNGALAAARSATQKSPNFGFAWARLAELEFSFGRIDAATAAVGKSLELSPRNAQALALSGFLFAARNKMELAMRAFNEAIAIDGRLGNAWLGRGLVQISNGNRVAGREDLLTAAAMEPQRAFLRSYLGKAWGEAHRTKLAEHELELAQHLDPRDPTAWLYAALLKQQNNRINEAIADLEHAQDLGGNRGVYRSEGMLSGDRAVRSANLANIYRDAGMIDWSIYEAGRAVSADYANYSAHLFLANSYDQLRDPNRINLRYETPAESEYLIANLLAPVAAGTLSHSVSQGEYSRFFEGNRFGLASTTEYLSRGAWHENGAQFGIFGNTAYSIEGIYRSDPGQRVNNDFEERDLRLQVKQQLTYKDSVFVRVTDLEASGGDRLQRYDQEMGNMGIRTHERQEPILTAGYHRQWSAESHTLIVGSRLDDTTWVNDPSQRLLYTERGTVGIGYVEPIFATQTYQSALEIYSAEVQQIWQTPRLETVIGARFQSGDFETASAQTNLFGAPTGLASSSLPNGTSEQFKTPFERLSLYGYQDWRVSDELLLVGGIAYDRIVHPENFRASPISNSTDTTDQVSPKAGFVWTPFDKTAVRGAYSRSLSGASIDQSLTIEPSQVAGFNQSFRSIISESVIGSDIAAQFETFGLSVDHRFDLGTYIGLTAQQLSSENHRELGTIAFASPFPAVAGAIQEDIDYRERALVATIDQLLGRHWAIGANYRLTKSRLHDVYPGIESGATLIDNFKAEQNLRATLHQVNLHARFNHPCGFFAEAGALWTEQDNFGYASALAGDSFWQVNILAGYRFMQRRAEIAFGALNLTDRDYKLNPLTPYLELPRERTFIMRVRLNF